MTWLRARVLPLTGVLCLAGQGTLLYLAGTGPGAPRLPWPFLFLVLSGLQALVLARAWNRADYPSVSSVSGWIFRVLALGAAVVLMGVGLGFISFGGTSSLPEAIRPDPAKNLTVAREALEALGPALDSFDQQMVSRF